MSERLLKEHVALKKIELSLKLQGKTFNAKFINCGNCKFYWKNKPNGMSAPPRWHATISRWTANGFEYVPNPDPEPEKAGWFCYKYKSSPTHAFLRFKVARLNAEGQEIKTAYYYNEQGQWTNVPRNGEVDALIFKQPGTSWQYRVCRRFEACPR